MNKPLLGLGALLIIAALFVPAFDYRDARYASMVQAERRFTDFQGLLAAYTQSRTPGTSTNEKTPQSLFALFNSRTGEIGLSDRVEKLRPQSERGNADTERLEARLSSVYQDQAISLLWALEREAGVRIESLMFSRTPQGLLDMDLVVARKGGTS